MRVYQHNPSGGFAFASAIVVRCHGNSIYTLPKWDAALATKKMGDGPPDWLPKQPVKFTSTPHLQARDMNET